MPQSLAVGSPDLVSNIELENQRLRITQDVFTGMNFSCAHGISFSLSSLSVLVSTVYLPVSYFSHYLFALFQCLRLSQSNFLCGLESDFLWLSLSYSVIHRELTKSHELMETRWLTPSFPEASQNYLAQFICAV